MKRYNFSTQLFNAMKYNNTNNTLHILCIDYLHFKSIYYILVYSVEWLVVFNWPLFVGNSDYLIFS